MAKQRNGLSESEAGKLGAIKSKETRDRNKAIQVENYYKTPKRCLHCNAIIDFEHRYNKFCSQSCAVTYTNLHRDKSIRLKQRNTLLETLANKKTSNIKPSVCCNNTHKNLPKKIKPTKPKYCKYCGAIKGQCKDNFVCSKYQLYKNLEKFGFNSSVIGTEAIISEFYRVKTVIEKFYNEHASNANKLVEVFNYTSGSANFIKIIKSLNIETKTHSEANIASIIAGRTKLLENNNSYPYKSEWHTTWEGNEVYLRSSYEKEYAEELDSKHIKYDVECLRIKYFSSEKNTYRCAIPDFYLLESNTIVEIKSSYTLNLQEMKDKFKAYKDLGYNVKLYLDKKEVDLYSLTEKDLRIH